MTQLWAILLAVLSGILGGVGVILLKKGADKFNLNILQQIRNKYLVLGMACCGTGMIALLIAFKGGELSVLYPIISLQYIISTLLAVKYLKEKMNLLKWAGITAIIIGIILIGLGI
ncbi:EamA family transporter [Candidatus Woesearchaeota archaeon]|nr:EamA family transporter [Candidatus Woesearchaeota archaeon]